MCNGKAPVGLHNESCGFFYAGGDTVELERRTRDAAFGAWLGIFVNVLLAAGKMTAGVLAGSVGMVADAAHSASDVLASGVVLLGVRVAGRPADSCHPYGHAKAEAIAAKIVAILLLLAAVNIGWSSLRAILNGVAAPPGSLALWAAAASILVKEALFQYKIKLGRRLRSQAVIANAWEHRSDVLSSVAVLVGVAGARAGYPLLDPVAGLLVSVMVARIGWTMATEAVDDLMDGMAGDGIMVAIVDAARRIDGVLEIHDVRARRMGHKVLVDMKIGVDENMTVAASHGVAHRVKDAVMARVEEVSDVLVHVNPVKRMNEG